MSPALTKHVERIMIRSRTFCELRNVGVRFGEVEAVRDVTLDVPRASSKSAGPFGLRQEHVAARDRGLHHPLVGQDPPQRLDVTAAAPQVRRIGMVFQNYALFPHMTVGDNIAFGLRRQGKTQAPR